MKVMHERVAGIDVHKDMVKVAPVRGRNGGAEDEVLTFGTFYGVLREMARELQGGG